MMTEQPPPVTEYLTLDAENIFFQVSVLQKLPGIGRLAGAAVISVEDKSTVALMWTWMDPREGINQFKTGFFHKETGEFLGEAILKKEEGS